MESIDNYGETMVQEAHYPVPASYLVSQARCTAAQVTYYPLPVLACYQATASIRSHV